MDQTQEIFSMILIANGQSSKVMQPGKESLISRLPHPWNCVADDFLGFFWGGAEDEITSSIRLHCSDVSSILILLRAFEYPIRSRWGKHAEEGFGGKPRVPPSIIRL